MSKLSEYRQLRDTYARHHPIQYARRIAFDITFNNLPF